MTRKAFRFVGRIRARALACGLTAVLGTAGLAQVSVAQSATAAAAVPAVAQVSTPPMGWASWNTFAAKINASVIKGQADALASSGMKAAGYQYVNIDEGWWQGTRDASGGITVSSTDRPGGMQAVAAYIHSKG